jgi:nucleotide-binding universal stress UspA family protein
MNFLVATGGSPHSKLAVGMAVYMAKETGGSVALVCVQDREARDCQAVFKESAPLLADMGEVRAHVRHGQPAEEIIREAETEPYDMIVLGEKGHHTPLTRFLLGPTAERVASAAPIPVLVVKGNPAAGPRRVRRILLSVALRRQLDQLDRVLRRVSAIAKYTGATVTVLHVMSQLPLAAAGAPDDWEEEADELIRSETAEGDMFAYVKNWFAQDGVAAFPLVRHGLVIDEVLAEAEGDYDLLVIGGHEPGTWLRNLLLENVALQILHRTRLPILTVHG